MSPDDEPTVPMMRYLDAKFAALDRALDLAREQNEIRLHNLNEWKAHTTDERRYFAKQEQVDRLQRWVDQSGGRWQALTVGTAVLSIITLLITLGRLSGIVR